MSIVKQQENQEELKKHIAKMVDKSYVMNIKLQAETADASEYNTEPVCINTIITITLKLPNLTEQNT